jgi:WD40 repeat protein
MMSKNVVLLVLPVLFLLGLGSGCQKSETEKQPTFPESPVPGPPEYAPMGNPPGPSKVMTEVAFSPNGKYLLLGYKVFRGKDAYRSKDPLPYANLIDAASGDLVYSFPQEEDSMVVKRLEFLPNNQRAIVTLSDGGVLFLDLTQRKVLWRKPLGVMSVSPDGTRLFSQTAQNGVTIWDVSGKTPVLVENIDRQTRDGECLRIHQRGALFDNQRVLSWTAKSKNVTKYWSWDLIKGEIAGLDLPDCSLYGRSPDGKYLLFRINQTEPWVEKEEFRLWDAKAAKVVAATADNWKWPVVTKARKLEHVPGGGLWIEYLRFWDLPTGKESRAPSKEAAGGILSPDGTRAFFSDALWDVSKCTRLWTLRTQ